MAQAIAGDDHRVGGQHGALHLAAGALVAFEVGLKAHERRIGGAGTAIRRVGADALVEFAAPRGRPDHEVVRPCPHRRQQVFRWRHLRRGHQHGHAASNRSNRLETTGP